MSGRVRIAKMSGAGNDFVVLDPDAAASLSVGLPEWVRRVCRRGLSVGADGVLVVSPEGGDVVRVTFYNPDGGIAFCGNGSRCAARYAHRRGWVGAVFELETAVGTVPAEIDGARVRITLPPPVDLGPATAVLEGISTYVGRRVLAGVPHYVIGVDEVETVPIATIGPALRRHPTLGSEGANVNFTQAVDPGRIRIRTFERGVEGETLSCGTGAVAAAFARRLAGGPESIVVIPRSGVALGVRLPGRATEPSAAVLEGDARFVFDGDLDPEATQGFERS